MFCKYNYVFLLIEIGHNSFNKHTPTNTAKLVFIYYTITSFSKKLFFFGSTRSFVYQKDSGSKRSSVKHSWWSLLKYTCRSFSESCLEQLLCMEPVEEKELYSRRCPRIFLEFKKHAQMRLCPKCS